MLYNNSGGSFYGDETPIAAIATVVGNSAITLIRCSGKNSIELVSSVFVPAGKSSFIKNAPGNTVIHGWVVKLRDQKEEIGEKRGDIENNELIDEVLISVFRAPKSYTGEDSLDICCHGGHNAGFAVMDALKSAGFRDALPGEFTFRAFMNGKIDLTKSESVMELVSAKTETGRRRAVSRLCGSLQTEINEIKDILVRVLAGAEIFLDYSEDEVSADTDEISGMLPNRDIALEAHSRLKKLSDTWRTERIYQEGITCVIAGRPNAGKSSLFNLFLREDRSIVTDVPGTTRDWIEAWISIEGIPVRLIDTAGLRDTDDSVEKIGVLRSRMLLQEADIVLYLIDGAEGLTYEDKAECGMFNAEESESGDHAWSSLIKNNSVLLLWNKCDIAKPFPSDNFSPVCLSAKTGEGLTELHAAISSVILRQAGSMNEPSAASIGTIRQKNLVDSACSALGEALVLAEKEEPLDLIAPLLRDAVNSLGEITGEISTADILEEMFSKFCVGK